jgi:hypothetical protein
MSSEIEIVVTETGFDKATHDWLVSVGVGGMTRIVATCPYPECAAVVAMALGRLTVEELEALGEKPVRRSA